MALTQISTKGIKDSTIATVDLADDAVTQGKLADDAVGSPHLNTAVTGSNGQFLKKDDTSAGGLTWADANSYTHPNHSGEVTSSADGAQTIASNVVDEDNLKISNAGTNGQYLQKQSGNTGGLTWSDVNANGIGNHFTAVAEGAIAANKPVYISRTNGKVTQPSESTTVLSTPLAGQATTHGNNDSRNEGWCSLGGNYFWFGFKNGNAGDDVYGRLVTYNSSSDTVSFGSQALVGGTNSGSEFITPVYDSTADRFMVVWRYGDNSLDYIVGNRSGTSLSYGSQGNFNSGYDGSNQPISVAGAFNPDERGMTFIWQEGGETKVGNAQVSTSANTATLGGVGQGLTASAWERNGCDICYDTTTNRFLAVYSERFASSYNLTFQVGKPNSGTSVTWGTKLTINTADASTARICKAPRLAFDPDSGLCLCVANDTTNNKMVQFPIQITGGTTNTAALADTNSPTVFESYGSGGYGLVYDTAANKMIFFYRDNNNSNRPTAMLGTYSANYSGTNDYYTWSSATQLSTASMGNYGSDASAGSDGAHSPLVVLPAGGRAIGYWHPGYPQSQSTAIIKTTNTTHNLTGHDYVGFPDAAYSDGQTVTVKTEGNVVSGFSGLSGSNAVYGDTQGNIGTASSGSALSYQNLGKALGSDKIHIKVAYQ